VPLLQIATGTYGNLLVAAARFGCCRVLYGVIYDSLTFSSRFIFQGLIYVSLET